MEYQLESVFMGKTLERGLPQLGYPCIVGAGPNAATLHYDRNNCQVRPGGGAGCATQSYQSHHVSKSIMVLKEIMN